MQSQVPPPSFFGRLKLAFRILSDTKLAQSVLSGAEKTPAVQAPAAAPAAIPAPKPLPLAQASVESPGVAAHPDHSSALVLLGMLQREGRLIDFLQEEIDSFADAEIGAAARVVHAGSKKVLRQYLTLEPILPNAEGDQVAVKPGFDAQRIRLLGNVAGQPPFRGALKHHGWYASDVRFPTQSSAVDPKVISPAEVEL